eukprot:CAMPEP_0194339202 /NCGR_PEP_ID=MMETSP0171-20130528/82162_1 /TAXON_ID=218684 /ORGANISM="Corethron pennatum, Strain L29A3" /LENGTH=170 /DNA_ID=CAMNT_0039103641 /DNA_START=100 /DNA_END=609 /DNA_ORIENTATION=+
MSDRPPDDGAAGDAGAPADSSAPAPAAAAVPYADPLYALARAQTDPGWGPLLLLDPTTGDPPHDLSVRSLDGSVPCARLHAIVCALCDGVFEGLHAASFGREGIPLLTTARAHAPAGPDGAPPRVRLGRLESLQYKERRVEITCRLTQWSRAVAGSVALHAVWCPRGPKH